MATKKAAEPATSPCPRCGGTRTAPVPSNPPQAACPDCGETFVLEPVA